MLVHVFGGEIRVDTHGFSADRSEPALGTVVCWPAGGRPGTDLEPFAAELVAAGYQVALIHPRGCFDSPAPTNELTLADLADDAAAVIGALTAEFGLAGPVTVLGHAFGNRIMRCLAMRRPDLVSGVVLLAAGGMVEPQNFDDLAMVRKRGISRDERKAALGRAYFEEGSDPELWMQSAGPGVFTLYRTVILPDLDEWWSGGDAPMLVVQGGLDRSAPPANGEALASDYPDRVTLVTIAEAAHALPVERPTEVATHVLSWLADADSS